MKKFLVAGVVLACLPGIVTAQQLTEAPGAGGKGEPPFPGRGVIGAFLGCFPCALPAGLCVGLEHDGSGDLLNTEIVADDVYIQTTAGALVSSFSVAANSPGALGVGTDGSSIWVTDTGADEVDEYSSAGAFIGSFSVVGQTTFPEGVTYNTTTGTLFVVDGAGGNMVHEYSIAGALLNSFPILGSSPDGIAWDQMRSHFWLYDSGTDTVTQYDPTFTAVDSFPGPGANGAGNGEGTALIGDTVYVSAPAGNEVCAFDVTGAVPVELQSFDVE